MVIGIICVQQFSQATMQLKPGHLTGDMRTNQNSTSQRINFQDYNYQYYQEYKRLYQTAFLLSLQVKQIARSKDEVEAKLAKIQKKNEDFKDDQKGEPHDRKKRFRRTAETIERRFVCDVERCHKCYGSDGSLQQHIKLKHPELYESKSQHRHEAQADSQYCQEQFS